MLGFERETTPRACRHRAGTDPAIKQPAEGSTKSTIAPVKEKPLDKTVLVAGQKSRNAAAAMHNAKATRCVFPHMQIEQQGNMHHLCAHFVAGMPTVFLSPNVRLDCSVYVTHFRQRNVCCIHMT